MAMKIVILEDNAERRAEMTSWFQDRFYSFDARFFDNAPEMIRFLKSHLEETILICLDHDLEMKPGRDDTWVDPGSGRDVADYLVTERPVCPVIIHTTNSAAATGMETILQDAHWQTSRVIPFDDLEWISSCWFPTVRRALLGMAKKRIAEADEVIAKE